MTTALMPFIVGNGIACQQTTHKGGKGNPARAQQQMKMVGNQSPGVTGRICFRQQGMKPLQKVPAIVIITKYFVPFDASDNDVMNKVGNIEAWLSWHEKEYSLRLKSNQARTSPKSLTLGTETNSRLDLVIQK